MLWDIFCKVIDNHGDIGVCWRLSAQLAARGDRVRLWVDDGSALRWMAPGGEPRVEVLAWNAQVHQPQLGDVVIEAFGCHLDERFEAAIAAKAAQDGRQPVWINLEYLSAQRYAARNHRLPSPVMAGPAAGLVKRFFYPGVHEGSGGLLRELGLMERQAGFNRGAWLRSQGIDAGDEQFVSLFCYEPPPLADLLCLFANGPARTRLLVTQGRAQAATRVSVEGLDREHPGWNEACRLRVEYLPLLSQVDFDHLLWSCDLNFVRGEDSLVRALWAGKPLVWNIYPQYDDAHHEKLSAFLDWLEAPPSMRQFHAAWNGIDTSIEGVVDASAWEACVMRARQRLLAQDDLATQLVRLVAAESVSP